MYLNRHGLMVNVTKKIVSSIIFKNLLSYQHLYYLNILYIYITGDMQFSSLKENTFEIVKQRMKYSKENKPFILHVV